VQTDSSNVGLGAFLHQLEDDGRLRVISFASRILQGPERNYYATELKALAIVWALEKWRDLLFGRKFTIKTDCKALTF
jgi:hypothetical protein